MSVPEFKEFLKPTLLFFEDEKIHSRTEIADLNAKYFKLTDEDMTELTKGGGKNSNPKYKDRSFWAIYWLQGAEILEKISKGHYKITKRGLNIIDENPEIIDETFLLQFPSFCRYRNKFFMKLVLDFKEIFEKYPIERKKQRKDNEFASKMENEFSLDLMDCLKEINVDNDNYVVKISPGSSNNWVNIPWAGITNINSTDTFNKGLYIFFTFDINNSKIHMSLNQGSDFLSIQIRKQIAEFLMDVFKNSDFSLIEGFVLDDSRVSRDAVMSKSYDLKNLSDQELKTDLKKLIKIYEFLIPYYNNYLYEMDPLPNDIRPENDSYRVWKISAGPSEISDELWDIFKREGYVGIDFNYGHDDVDYSKFKNKNAIALFLQDDINSKSLAPSTIWKFVNIIRKGDIIVVNKGTSKLAGIGVVASDFIPQTENDNKNEFGYNNVRKVNWIITPDVLKINDNFFATQNLVEMSNYPLYWNQLIYAVSRTDDNLKQRILKYLFNQFWNDYFKTSVGKEHLKKYDEESDQVNNAWDEIISKNSNNEDISEDMWENIIDRSIKVHADPVNNIKNNFESKFKYSNEDLKRVSWELFELLRKLKQSTLDLSDKKYIVEEYYKSEYSKGFQSGRISSILNYLDDSYNVVNNKTVYTIKALSWIFGDEVKFDTDLKHYIDNNEYVNKFLKKLNNLLVYEKFDITDFRTFDTFCHWMCDKKLGYFAGKSSKLGNMLPVELLGNIDVTLKPEQKNYAKINLNPDKLGDKLNGFEISQNIVSQLCASLNAGKHIILDGTPGTGKTELAIKFSSVAEENKFIDGYVLTTATSDWSTFDTIGGLMPTEEGNLQFHQGKFLEAIELNKWLIIDEINRSDIDKAFGQLFTVLSGQTVELPYKENGKSIKIKNWDETYCKHDKENGIYYIGSNWRIIGTMNVDDKDSLFDLSYAFMRRFMFIEVDLPDKENYVNLIKRWANNLDDDYAEKLTQLYSIVEYRKLGPAIFKDMISYIEERNKFENSSYEEVLSEAINSYIVPQLEGLNKKQLKEIIGFFSELGIENISENLNALIPTL